MVPISYPSDIFSYSLPNPSKFRVRGFSGGRYQVGTLTKRQNYGETRGKDSYVKIIWGTLLLCKPSIYIQSSVAPQY